MSRSEETIQAPAPNPAPVNNEISANIEKIDLMKLSETQVQAAANNPVKRPVGRPKGTVNSKPDERTQQAQGQNTQIVQGQALPLNTDYKFTLKKIFSTAERLLQKKYSAEETSTKIISSEKELEDLSKDADEGLKILVNEYQLVFLNKIIKFAGLVIVIAAYAIDKYLIILEIKAKIESKLSKQTTAPNQAVS